MSRNLPDPFFADSFFDPVRQYSLDAWIMIGSCAAIACGSLFYLIVYFAAPVPRAPRPAEKTFTTITPSGSPSEPEELPCWYDLYVAEKGQQTAAPQIHDAELFMSVVVPAFNEEKRLRVMLEEAVEFLELEYGNPEPSKEANLRQRNKSQGNGSVAAQSGWEVLVVSDGSTDATCQVALDVAKTHLGGSIRVVKLEQNRGKGGAVVHGMRHVRGSCVVFADADGASKFKDLRKLVQACRSVQDRYGRAVAIGSRAHLVGSEEVVKRSKLRNFLMHSFHLLLRIFTPSATSKIKDTQCGFKLFSRQSLPYIVPHMHSQGWIFDVEMLMLAELAEIPMIEVAIAWKEVQGSKLNPLIDSLGMAWGLFILRAAWAMGVYSVK